MLAFPTFSINNNNTLFQYNIQPDPNFTIPIIVSFPSLTPYSSCINVPYSFLMNLNNQSCYAPQVPIENNHQLTSLNVPEQVKDNLIKKMMTMINTNQQNIDQSKNLNSPLNQSSDFSMKPCISPSSSQNLKACLQSPTNSIKKNARVHFTKEEDDKIKELVKKFGTKNWSIIALFMEGRTAKQCRDRYSNYLIPGFFQGEWSKEEDDLLKKLYTEYGSKWSIIQTYFPNRSSNSIKNRWYYFLRKKNENGVKDENDYSDDNEKNNNSDEIELTDEDDKNEIKHHKILNEVQNKAEIQLKEENENIFELENELIDNLNNNNLLFDDEWIVFN